MLVLLHNRSHGRCSCHRIRKSFEFLWASFGWLRYNQSRMQWRKHVLRFQISCHSQRYSRKRLSLCLRNHRSRKHMLIKRRNNCSYHFYLSCLSKQCHCIETSTWARPCFCRYRSWQNSLLKLQDWSNEWCCLRNFSWSRCSCRWLGYWRWTRVHYDQELMGSHMGWQRIHQGRFCRRWRNLRRQHGCLLTQN